MCLPPVELTAPPNADEENRVAADVALVTGAVEETADELAGVLPKLNTAAGVEPVADETRST